MNHPKPYKSALVVLSGGQDSTTCLYLAKNNLAETVHALTLDYGQRHMRELACAVKVAEMAHIASHEVVQVGPLLKGTSPLVNPAERVERYAGAGALPGGIEKTFVPLRNLLFITVAANRAVILGCDAMVLGISQADYGGYPDCREPFLYAAEKAVNLAIGESAPNLALLAPLLFLDKADTVKMAHDLPGCWEALAHTHTCYSGEFPPCGECHACLLRAKGFAEAKLYDPLDERAARVADERRVH